MREKTADNSLTRRERKLNKEKGNTVEGENCEITRGKKPGKHREGKKQTGLIARVKNNEISEKTQ